jgi:N utilization substance protein B
MYALESVEDKPTADQLILDVLTANGLSVSETDIKKKVDTKHYVNLVRFAVKNEAEIATYIEEYLSSEWKLSRLPRLLKHILAIGIAEMIINENLASAMIINEYVEISKLFQHDGEAGFINSILDKVCKAQPWISSSS